MFDQLSVSDDDAERPVKPEKRRRRKNKKKSREKKGRKGDSDEEDIEGNVEDGVWSSLGTATSPHVLHKSQSVGLSQPLGVNAAFV